MGEYHDLYLKCDLLLLCDVFEKFISVCLKDCGLYPSHYYSSSGLSWDAMVKMIGVRLEKIDNTDVHLLLEKRMRDGVSYISKRFSKSSNDKTTMYWDMNNIYRTIMSIDYLPYEGFKFLSEGEIDGFDLGIIPENSLIGYILHNDYLLCPEKNEVIYDMLSKYCKEFVDRYDIKVGGVKKLIPNLSNKIRYSIHYKNLIYYLSLGMNLIKICRILSFKQSNWLKVLTDFNTEKKKNSPDEFSKYLYKLINSCIYSEIIEK